MAAVPAGMKTPMAGGPWGFCNTSIGGAAGAALTASQPWRAFRRGFFLFST
jgi:hypothetical protein